MAKDKHSFILYSDIHFTLKKLTDEQSGKLFKHILAYVNDENPVMDDLLLEVAFEPIKQALKRDLKRYEAICQRNKDNGLKGGRPKKKPKKPSGLIGNPKNPDEPKKADNDNDIDNGIDIEQKEDNNIYDFFPRFWEQYHIITKLLKTDKNDAEKYWKKLSVSERQKALQNIKPYYDSLRDKKYCKKARTYLSDKNFNDEFVPFRQLVEKLMMP